MTPPSARVRLEVAFLDGDQTPAPDCISARDERTITVLVVAAEPDLRRYVRECLRERTDLRLVEAATVATAVTVAAADFPEFLIVDEPQGEVLLTLSQLRAIMIVDEVPRDEPAKGTRHQPLGREGAGEQPVAEVGLLLG